MQSVFLILGNPKGRNISGAMVEPYLGGKKTLLGIVSVLGDSSSCLPVVDLLVCVICVCVCTWVGARCMDMGVEQMLSSGCLPQSLLCPLRQDLTLNQELGILARLTGDPLVSAPQH